MLYCLWNCQLKSNTWNATAQLKQPSPPVQGPNWSGPQRMFFFPSLTLSLLVKSCRQCTFTLAYIDHKSPKPDVLLNVLIKPISWVERMAGLQCKPAWGTLLRKKTVVILSSSQSTVGTPHPTHTVCTSPVPDVFHALICFPHKSETEQTERWRKEKCLSYSTAAPPDQSRPHWVLYKGLLSYKPCHLFRWIELFQGSFIVTQAMLLSAVPNHTVLGALGDRRLLWFALSYMLQAA